MVESSTACAVAGVDAFEDWKSETAGSGENGASDPHVFIRLSHAVVKAPDIGGRNRENLQKQLDDIAQSSDPTFVYNYVRMCKAIVCYGTKKHKDPDPLRGFYDQRDFHLDFQAIGSCPQAHSATSFSVRGRGTKVVAGHLKVTIYKEYHWWFSTG